MLPLLSEFVKVALVLSKADRKVSAHLQAEKQDKKWLSFNRSLKNPVFQQSAAAHPDADAKLKKYVENYGALVQSKEIVGRVKSTTTPSKTYTLKKLPGGRVGCTCKDWQFIHSINGTDCKHIKRMQLLTKTSTVQAFTAGLGFSHKLHHDLAEGQKGKAVKQVLRRQEIRR